MWRTDSFEKTLMLGKIEGGRRRGWQRMRWLDGITDSTDVESEWTLGVGDGQGGLACCSQWGRKESNLTERLNWNKLIWNAIKIIVNHHRVLIYQYWLWVKILEYNFWVKNYILVLIYETKFLNISAPNSPNYSICGYQFYQILNSSVSFFHAPRHRNFHVLIFQPSE